MIESRTDGAGRLVWSVAALVHAVADALQARFGSCAVRGEISGFSRAASGHCYFSLKDADGETALLRCAMFRRAAALLDFAPTDGAQVEVRGRLTLYEPRGELQFAIESMTRAGEGALYEQFLRLKARLEAEGLFDAVRKRPVPAFVRRIGVVTSLGAAALHDVLTLLARRCPHVEVIVYPSLVQGAQAPAALVEALRVAGERREVDALIICRGGGSLEDLWAFNDERLVRAIAAFPLPIVCGVGHETDVTLADFAADLRAPTPTAAAELVSKPTRELAEVLQRLEQKLSRGLRSRLDGQAQRLDRLALRLARPGERLRQQGHRLALLDQRCRAALTQRLFFERDRLQQDTRRLSQAANQHVERLRAKLEHLAARAHALDPRRVMARGYAWVSDTQGQPVTAARQLVHGQLLRASWTDGHADAAVTSIDVDESPHR